MERDRVRYELSTVLSAFNKIPGGVTIIKKEPDDPVMTGCRSGGMAYLNHGILYLKV